LPRSFAADSPALPVLLEGVKAQCGNPGIMEPFPLYMADRMVKHLWKALPAIRRAATQETAETSSMETGDIFLAMHGYRTEWG
nr:nuclease [Candidatus Sigynarchaeota archaeon]